MTKALKDRVTQLFDQMTVPDPPAPRPPAPRPAQQPLRVDLHLDRVFNTPASNALDLSRFSSSRTARRQQERPRPGTWVRSRLPGVGLVAAGALSGWPSPDSEPGREVTNENVFS